MATPSLPSPDDAYAAFKTAESALAADNATLATANTALTEAQAAQTSAATQVTTDTAAIEQAANTLIASLQQYVSGLQPSAPPAST